MCLIKGKKIVKEFTEFNKYELIWLNMLKSISQVSDDRAATVVSRYRSVKQLIQAY